MKTLNAKSLLAAAMMIVAMSACSKSLQQKAESCNAGDPTKGTDYASGVALGQKDNTAASSAGTTDGKAAAQALTPTQGTNDGYNKGYNDGYTSAYNENYTVGYNGPNGKPAGINQGNIDVPYLMQQGYTNGYNKGLADGEDFGL